MITANKAYFLFPNNTQVIQVVGLQDITTGLYLNSATVTATLKNQRGIPDSVINNLALGYIANTNGDYQGTVDSSFSAELGSGYTLEITAVQGGVQSFFSLPVIVELRTN